MDCHSISWSLRPADENLHFLTISILEATLFLVPKGNDYVDNNNGDSSRDMLSNRIELREQGDGAHEHIAKNGSERAERTSEIKKRSKHQENDAKVSGTGPASDSARVFRTSVSLHEEINGTRRTHSITPAHTAKLSYGYSSSVRSERRVTRSGSI